MKVMGVKKHPTLDTIFEDAVLKQAKKIIVDPTHVLYPEYQLLPSGRRYRIPTKNKKRYLNRYKKSFLPRSINLLNIGR